MQNKLVLHTEQHGDGLELEKFLVTKWTLGLSSEPAPPEKVIIYARVSNSENRTNLDAQAKRLVDYCIAKGWQINKIVKEVWSGVNDSRKKLLKILTDETITIIVVEHKDRLTRFGFNYIEKLLALSGRRIEVVNLAADGKEDLLGNLVSIIYSFCARL